MGVLLEKRVQALPLHLPSSGDCVSRQRGGRTHGGMRTRSFLTVKPH